MSRISQLVLLLLAVQLSLHAQPVPQWNAAKIKLQLEKLATLGSVLYVAAHPDDENTRLLAYLSNGKKYRTGYLALTRGDGGQNLVGSEQGSFLGLMRTEELLGARHIDGAEQFFSRANDFGFSKSAKEAFAFWGHDRILADAVWVIRKFRPDVIICRFPEDKRAGHGHHWASAIIGHEAFLAAADSTRFPEQLKYVKPWKARCVLWNTFNFGGRNTTAPDQLRIDVGGYSPLLGEGFGEVAAESRSMHKSQGFGVARSYGQSWEYFKTIAGTPPRDSLLDGINTSWGRVAGGEAVGELIGQALAQYNEDQPDKIVPLLLKAYAAMNEVKDPYWRVEKQKELKQLIVACCGLWLDAYTDQRYIVAGQSVKVRTEVINRSEVPVRLQSVDIAGHAHPLSEALENNQLQESTYLVTIPSEAPISQPYWLLEKHPVGYYHIADQQLVGKPENPPSVTARFSLDIDGTPLVLTLPLLYKYADPVRGEVQDPLVVTPPATANVQQEVYVFTSQQPQQINVKIRGYKDGVSGVAHLHAPAGFLVTHNDQAFNLKQAGDEVMLHFGVAPATAVDTSSSGLLSVQLKIGADVYNRSIRVISHDYIPTITVFPFAEAKAVAVPLNTSGHRVGYVMGAGDKVPQSLQQMGYQVSLLNDADLMTGRLQSFDAIVIGIRAYNTNEGLKYAHQRLMEYVRQGGTLVIQYNKNQGLVTRELGPYPFEVVNKRITDETAVVKLLLPEDPVLQFPNKITEKDFEGWIQERGVYYVDRVDGHYRKPLSMHDPDEAPLDGALIVCDYGKGKYVYTGLDFFRELPAGVPGAFRLFANLIAKRQP